MINKNNIKFNEPIYYVPSYGVAVNVLLIKPLANDMFLVKPHSKKKDFKAYPTHFDYIFNDEISANRSRRDWEKFVKKYKQDKKTTKKKKEVNTIG